MTDAQAVSLGKRLRQERESHHWTQEELAEKIGGSVPSINRWENGMATPRPGLLTLLIEVFGRSPERWSAAESDLVSVWIAVRDLAHAVG
jgi:transcriptional regulator with XRE-family HTH domain